VALIVSPTAEPFPLEEIRSRLDRGGCRLTILDDGDPGGETLPDDVDLVCAMGGDGTVLRPC